MYTPTNDEIKAILLEHRKWWRGDEGSRADLRGADLRDAKLQGTDLRGADLRDADLRGAYLRGAKLRGAYLRGAYLRGAKLQGARNINRFLCTPLLMLYDQPGAIRAYKLVNERGEGPYFGGIIYEVGESYSVDNANTDISIQCAEGISVATLDWCMKDWLTGYRILIVEHTAEDIAAIPTATDGKYRLHRCKVVGEKNLAEIGLGESDD